MTLLLAVPLSLATPAFDPTSPEARFTGQETYTLDGGARLWSAIERHEDPDRQLFGQDNFNVATEWPEDAAWAPWIPDCFGTQRPHAASFLLHVGPGEPQASGTPVLFVPGAGDNGSRGTITMATNLDWQGRPVYALTFANPHGDVFQHAEVIANAIARIRARTGAEQVDLVAHSKGGVAAAVYVSHTPDADWGGHTYEAVGTPYRGDVRRLVLIGTPLAGIDTGFRWSSINLLSLDAETAMAPTTWSTYYPSTSSWSWVYTDLADQDMLADGEDLFPGQRQIYARQSAPLPGEMPWLGAYAVQWDWWTTYEGGLGFYSWSPGIDAVVDEGGDLIARLARQGADPEVELFLLAGTNPLMPNAALDVLAMTFGQVWVDLATASTDLWAAFLAELVGEGLVSVGFEQEDIQGLASNKLVLGEISGPSDGLVFVDSALYGPALTARGATVIEAREVNLSHLDLLNASVTFGQALIAEAEADPVEEGWKAAVGRRYVEANTVGWLIDVLADDPGDTGGEDTGGEDTGGEDTGGEDTAGVEDSEEDTAGDDDTGSSDDGGKGTSACSAAAGPRPFGWIAGALALLALARRRP